MARKRVSRNKRQKNVRVSEKIEKLRNEGVPDGHGQAGAMATNMERAGRLRRHGVYRRARKSKRRE